MAHSDTTADDRRLVFIERTIKRASLKVWNLAGFVFAIVCGQLMTTTAIAQISYPMVMSLKPVAVQIGTTTECEVNSRYTMLGTYQVTVGGGGVTAEVVPPEMPELKPGEKPKELTKLKVKFTVTPEAVPGVREFRLATPNGASTIGQLVVVRDPVVFEIPDNNTLEKGQAVTLPATLCGVIEKGEDFDFWKFTVDMPIRFSFCEIPKGACSQCPTMPSSPIRF